MAHKEYSIERFRQVNSVLAAGVAEILEESQAYCESAIQAAARQKGEKPLISLLDEMGKGLESLPALATCHDWLARLGPMMPKLDDKLRPDIEDLRQEVEVLASYLNAQMVLMPLLRKRKPMAEAVVKATFGHNELLHRLLYEVIRAEAGRLADAAKANRRVLPPSGGFFPGASRIAELDVTKMGAPFTSVREGDPRFPSWRERQENEE